MSNGENSPKREENTINTEENILMGTSQTLKDKTNDEEIGDYLIGETKYR